MLCAFHNHRLNYTPVLRISSSEVACLSTLYLLFTIQTPVLLIQNVHYSETECDCVRFELSQWCVFLVCDVVPFCVFQTIILHLQWTALPWRSRHCDPLKCQELVTQQHNITSQRTWFYWMWLYCTGRQLCHITVMLVLWMSVTFVAAAWRCCIKLHWMLCRA